jgi:murein DD-endopeptidase MepM/ murein hydrolase activator NlpD
LLCILALSLALVLPPPAHAAEPKPPPPEESVQAFLDALPGPLKSFRDGETTAAAAIEGAAAYYGLNPRILLALLEAANGLLSTPAPPAETLQRPFGPAGPAGFAVQTDWAARELRAGLGPYARPPAVSFADGTQVVLTLDQAPEGVALQRFAARGRTQAEWRSVVERFNQAFQTYFDNLLPDPPDPAVSGGWLLRPWPEGVRVVHLAYFDHAFPTVDTGRRGDGAVVTYLGGGSVQYDGHDGHDFVFPDRPIGTPILAAADGVAYASTHRGNGVWIRHPGGYETVYWHLDSFAPPFRALVNSGRGVAVRAGDVLGTSGRSGFVKGTSHLHFEVRRNGRQVDPYGWYGTGPDPCLAYAGCAESPWLWHPSLLGEFDFSPPTATALDRTPPLVTLAINPPDDLRLLARLDGDPLQQVGAGTPLVVGAPQYSELSTGRGVQLGRNDRLAYPTAGNLSLDAGTIALWARLPERYPSGSRLQYLLAASANPNATPVFTGTLALRRDLFAKDGVPRWTFWTTGDRGEASRNDLSTPDTLTPGLHHFVIVWDRAGGEKRLYIDGKLAVGANGVELPTDIGALLAVGRYNPGSGTRGITIGELAVFGRALTASEVAELSAGPGPLVAPSRTTSREIVLDVNAFDQGGATVALQVGLNGQFGDPQPVEDRYLLTLPEASGVYTVAARVYDRAGNSTTVSTTLELDLPSGTVLR